MLPATDLASKVQMKQLLILGITCAFLAGLPNVERDSVNTSARRELKNRLIPAFLPFQLDRMLQCKHTLRVLR